MDDEDDILNVEFDPNELLEIDEDAVLGSAPSSSITKPTPAPSVIDSKTTVQNSKGTSNAKTNQKDHQPIDEPMISVDSGDDEEEDQIDGSRQKFQPERKQDVVTRNIQRPNADRISSIPDSLDNVRLNQKDAQFANANNNFTGKRRRGDFQRRGPVTSAPPEPKRILLNPHFRGSVPIRPPIRLAWDQQQPIHIRPPLSMHPPSQPGYGIPNNRMQMHSGASMIRSAPPPTQMLNLSPPRPQPMSSAPCLPPNIPPAMYRYPAPPMWTAQHSSVPPPLFSRAPVMSAPSPSRASTLYGSMPPMQSNSVLRPMANYSVPPPVIRPTPPRPTPPKPTASSMGSSVKQVSADEWFNMTEDFLRQNRLPLPVPTRVAICVDQQKANVSRQRQAAEEVKKKYRVQTDRVKKPLSTARSVEERSPSVSNDGSGSRSVKSGVEEGVDADYLRKLEEQKRMRELVLKRKEQRRSLMAKNRQDQHQSAAADDDETMTVTISSDSNGLSMKRPEISLTATTSKPLSQNQFVGRRRF